MKGREPTLDESIEGESKSRITRREFGLLAAAVLYEGVFQSVPAEAEETSVTAGSLEQYFADWRTEQQRLRELARLPRFEADKAKNFYAHLLSIQTVDDPRLQIPLRQLPPAGEHRTNREEVVAHLVEWAAGPQSSDGTRPQKLAATQRGEKAVLWVAGGRPSIARFEWLILFELDRAENVTSYVTVAPVAGQAPPVARGVCTIRIGLAP